MMHDELHRLILTCRNGLDELCRFEELLQIAIEQLACTSDQHDRLYLLIDAYRAGITLPINEIQSALRKMTVLLTSQYAVDYSSGEYEHE